MSIIEQMREESTKREAMVPRTIRLPPDLDDAIHNFAKEMNFDFSVVVRSIMSLGWSEFQKRNK